MRIPPLILLGLAATSVLASTSTSAATIVRSEFRLAALPCQAALPVFDGQIRKRPLAVQNEGNSNAFITCALEGIFGGVAHNSWVGVSLRNNTANAIDVTCTLVDGGSGLEAPVYFIKTLTLAANQEYKDLTWTTADNGGNKFIYPAISCNLPPGTGIVSTTRRYDEEIGT